VNVEDLLQRLKKVQKSGPGKWRAHCPAHESNSPSLAISEKDGTILLKCFVGCSAEDVCGAIGVEMWELFPPREREYEAQPKVYIGGIKFTALDALRCLKNEGSVILLLACDMAEGKVLSAVERDRVTLACSRMGAALEFVGDNDIEKVTIE
jgi:hypothetical protein